MVGFSQVHHVISVLFLEDVVALRSVGCFLNVSAGVLQPWSEDSWSTQAEPTAGVHKLTAGVYKPTAGVC